MNDLLKINSNPKFSAELPADPITNNQSRQVVGACFSYVDTKQPLQPKLIHYSSWFLKELNLEIKDQSEFLKVMSGQVKFNHFKPYAMCYGGHQFGNWAGQLGDGRAINIAELDIKKTNWKFQLKGSGPTPYSRHSDGLAVLRSSVREYLCSEAMHHLGVPTTRALSLIKTGDLVPRDMLYDGHVKNEQGAIVCRVSPSFIRFGSFEIFASRQDNDSLKKLVDYTIKNHYSDLGEPSKTTYLEFFKTVAIKTKNMIIHWQRVGFVHGVMNTDNMSILGLTIDYGPYGWLDNFDLDWTPNTTDAQNKRYRYGNQPNMALWNLTQLANTLYPLIQEVEPLQNVLTEFKDSFLADKHQMMSNKLGLYQTDLISDDFITQLEHILTLTEIDMTIFFRELSNKNITDFKVFWSVLINSTYLTEKELGNNQQKWMKWHQTYSDFIIKENENSQIRSEKMNLINPKYTLRNYMAQLAIDAAENGDYDLIDELYQVILKPYDEQPKFEKWYAKRPDWAKHKVGCSMLSCSS